MRLKPAVIAAVAGFIVTGTSVAGITAASASTGNSCTAQGDYAVCTAGATFNSPSGLTVSVTASPDQQVSVEWTDTCGYGDGAGSDSGSFSAETPASRIVSHPYAHPDSCVVAATAQLSGSGNLKVTLGTSLPATPALHEIKGYKGLCADANGDSSAARTHVQIWGCANDPAQRWSITSGELKHGSMCMNDQGTAGNGGHIILWKCDGAANETWTHTSSNEYVLKANGLCLDDPAYSTRNGTQLEVYRCDNGSNQHWSLP